MEERTLAALLSKAAVLPAVAEESRDREDDLPTLAALLPAPAGFNRAPVAPLPAPAGFNRAPAASGAGAAETSTPRRTAPSAARPSFRLAARARRAALA